MSKFADRAFWVDAGDRAFASFAQALIATGVFESAGVIGADWVGVLSLAGGYALTSVLSSIAFRGGEKGASGRHAADGVPVTVDMDEH